MLSFPTFNFELRADLAIIGNFNLKDCKEAAPEVRLIFCSVRTSTSRVPPQAFTCLATWSLEAFVQKTVRNPLSHSQAFNMSKPSNLGPLFVSIAPATTCVG